MMERFVPRRVGPGAHGDVPRASMDARIGRPRAPTGGKKDFTEEIAKYREELRARAERAAGGRVVKADQDVEYLPADSLSDFLEDAEAFGFHNFKTTVLPRSWCAEFNRFLQANRLIIGLGILDFENIPRKWLDNRDKKDPLPAAGKDPEDASSKMEDFLNKANYRLVLNEEVVEGVVIPSNYYTWLSIFNALKLVDKYRKTQAGGSNAAGLSG